MREKRQEDGARPKHDQRRERPHRAAKSRPQSLRAFGGHSRLLLIGIAARVLAAWKKESTSL